MAFQKGVPRPANAGRKAGSANKINKALKEMILGALDDAGGQEYLKRQATDQPAAFMSLLGRVLPATLAGDPENPIKHVFAWEQPSEPSGS